MEVVRAAERTGARRIVQANIAAKSCFSGKQANVVIK
jgi:hypothetical protein